ncbi:MAG: hypothetical protein KC503_01405 [Myxococcales bacterium]|nr:hypothetical protein [Myxococcales bacterium]
MSSLFRDAIATDQVRRILSLKPVGYGNTAGGGASMYDKQVRGIARLYNILCEHPLAYLADEVGMGKTYQGLGLACVLWNLDPDARVMVVAPRGNVQRKWAADYYAFLRNNYRHRDDRVVDCLLGRPVREPAICDNLTHLVSELVRDATRFFVLRHTSFMRPVVFSSSGRTQAGTIVKKKRGEFNLLHAYPAGELRDEFRRSTLANDEARQACMSWTAAAVNQSLPDVDLLIVDEAQCLRNRTNQSNRNFRRVFGLHQSPDERREELGRFLDGRTFGGHTPRCRVRRLLLLSATPAHSRVEDIASQLRYGLGLDDSDQLRQVIDALEQSQGDVARASDALRRVMVRRFRMFGQLNKYGYREEYAPAMRVEEDPLAELSTALVTKHVYRALKGRGNRFRVGFLSSFESLQDSIGRQTRASEDEDPPSEGTHTEEDGRPPDQGFITTLNRSFQQSFGIPLVHPKQRYVVDEARHILDPSRTPDLVKMLVFVRRIASVGELARDISAAYDEVVEQRLARLFDLDTVGVSPSLVETRLRELRGRGDDDQRGEHGGDEDDRAREDVGTTSRYLDLFRSRGSPGQWFRTRFNQGRALWWFFDENWVRTLWWLHTGGSQSLDAYLGGRGLSCSDTDAAYPTRHEAFYKSQLNVIDDVCRASAPGVCSFLRRRLARYADDADRAGAPDARLLLRTSFWNELLERGADGYASFLSFEPGDGQEDALYQREQIKAWMSKNLRMSEPIFDLAAAYRRHADDYGAMVRRFVDLVEEQPKLVRRLELLASHAILIDRTLGYDQRADRYDRLDGWAVFDEQNPVRGVLGGSGNRDIATRQFNTPFFPDVVVCTDVLREGVDLHLFCDRVVHYGLAYSPGDIEQRTGRIDRYFSKTYRAIETSTSHSSRLRVEYPYVASTLDELQLARVLSRRNEVQTLMDRGLPIPEFDRDMSAREKVDPVVDLLLKPSRERREDPFPALEGSGPTTVHVAPPEGWHDQARDHLRNALREFRRRYRTVGRADVYLEGKLDFRIARLTVAIVGRGEGKRLALVDETFQRVQAVQLTLDFLGEYRTHVVRARSWITKDSERQSTLDAWLSALPAAPVATFAAGVAVVHEHRRTSRRQVLNALVAESGIPFTREDQACTMHTDELADLVRRVALTADLYEEQLHGADDRVPEAGWR